MMLRPEIEWSLAHSKKATNFPTRAAPLPFRRVLPHGMPITNWACGAVAYCRHFDDRRASTAVFCCLAVACAVGGGFDFACVRTGTFWRAIVPITAAAKHRANNLVETP